MPSASITVNKQSVCEFLSTGARTRFLVPEYQRPYSWGEDEVQTLLDDLKEFSANTQNNSDATYFLGSVVSFENTQRELEIIDGQQRITTLFLLLRAIYAKLENASPSDERNNFMGQIAPALWHRDSLNGRIDKSRGFFVSRAISDEWNTSLQRILENGEINEGGKDAYSKNYRFIMEALDSFSEEDPLSIYHFIHAVLNKTILLPISAADQDTALTIFSTLNDRGLPLTDADIFKAKLYGHTPVEQRASFIRQWQKMEDEAKDSGETIQKIFNQSMFYDKALEGNRDSTLQGLRSFYLADNNRRLFANGLLNRLEKMIHFWSVVNSRADADDEGWVHDVKIRQLLDTLSHYPNEYWKYPVLSYFLAHGETDCFADNFRRFLQKLIAELLKRYCLRPTINAVKTGILKLDVAIVQDRHPTLDFGETDESLLPGALRVPHKNLLTMILCVLAYNKVQQADLLPKSWQVEHILPQKWQPTYFPNESAETVNELIEHIGNKIPLEQKLNIVASNGYFERKKNEYRHSSIQIAQSMAAMAQPDWNLDDIRSSDIRTTDFLIDLFHRWDAEYTSGNRSATPTPNEQAIIDDFRRRGLIS